MGIQTVKILVNLSSLTYAFQETWKLSRKVQAVQECILQTDVIQGEKVVVHVCQPYQAVLVDLKVLPLTSLCTDFQNKGSTSPLEMKQNKEMGFPRVAAF